MPPVDLKNIEPVIEILIDYINHERSDDCTKKELPADILWAVSYISDGPDERIDDILTYFDPKKFIELMIHNKDTIKVPALRIVGNIITGNDVQTQTMLDLNVIDNLKLLLESPIKESIRKEIMWTISNITAGNWQQCKVNKF